MRRVLFLLPILAVLIFAGCGGKQSVATSTKLITPNSFPVKIKLSTKKLQGRLFSQYSSWKGVPYRYGGLSKSGVDCSGFVFNAFKDGLGIVLPRSTKELVKIGKKVKKKKLRSGDLVFFKTGKKTR
ncbi:MAG: C40 family peptidase, partial [Deltaproteobacteria bacterium]|nr:C40 family peptidase [Deltaproteobacteria bacterium]